MKSYTSIDEIVYTAIDEIVYTAIDDIVYTAIDEIVYWYWWNRMLVLLKSYSGIDEIWFREKNKNRKETCIPNKFHRKQQLLEIIAIKWNLM